MADIFDELLGDAPVDPAQLVKRLRRERELGMVAQMTGIPQQQRMGPALQAGAVDQAQYVAGARQSALDKAEQRQVALQQSLMAAQQRAEDRSQRAQDRAADRALRQALAAQAAADRAARAKSDDVLTRAQQAIMDRHRQGQLAQLAKTLESSNLSGVAAAVVRAEKLLKKYDKDPKTGKYPGIPGVGGLYNVDIGSIGSALTNLPGGGGDEARANQAELAPLMNLVLQARSGAAVTNPELNRLLKESGLTWASSDADFRTAFAQLAKMSKQQVRDLLAGYDPDIVAEYLARGGLKDLNLDDETTTLGADAEVEDIFLRNQ